MVRLMVETVALHLAMCLNRALCEQVDRAEQPRLEKRRPTEVSVSPNWQHDGLLFAQA